MRTDIEAALRAPPVLWTEDVLHFADTEPNGHVNNATFSTPRRSAAFSDEMRRTAEALIRVSGP